MIGDPLPSGFQTKTALRILLESAGTNPRKRFGQHFLIDRNLMQKLVDAAEPGPNDCVLEVGAGTGSLTGLLAGAAGCVVAVEIDRELAGLAGELLADVPNVTLICGDALDRKSAISAEVLAALQRAQAKTGGLLKLAANLPYDIATPLVIDLLLCDLDFRQLCFTVQTEVADRFLAQPSTPDYGPVSIITQLLCTGHRICKVPPQAFWPEPRVNSTMLRLDRRPPAEIPVSKPGEFATFVRSFFQHRRKTISHTAKQKENAERIAAAIREAGLPPDARPENLTVAQWVEFYRRAS